MSSIIEKLNTKCVSCNILLDEKNMVKKRKKCNKCPNNNRTKIRNQLLNMFMKTIL